MKKYLSATIAVAVISIFAAHAGPAAAATVDFIGQNSPRITTIKPASSGALEWRVRNTGALVGVSGGEVEFFAPGGARFTKQADVATAYIAAGGGQEQDNALKLTGCKAADAGAVLECTLSIAGGSVASWPSGSEFIFKPAVFVDPNARPGTDSRAAHLSFQAEGADYVLDFGTLDLRVPTPAATPS